MKGNLHRRLSSLDFGNARDRGIPSGFKRRYKRESDKRARVSTALRNRGSDIPSNWEESPAVSVPTHNWAGSHNGRPVYAWVG